MNSLRRPYTLLHTLNGPAPRKTYSRDSIPRTESRHIGREGDHSGHRYLFAELREKTKSKTKHKILDVALILKETGKPPDSTFKRHGPAF